MAKNNLENAMDKKKIPPMPPLIYPNKEVSNYYINLVP